MNKTLLLILIAGICGGSVYPLIKIADTYNIPRFAYIFWESFFIILLLSTLALLRSQKIRLTKNECPYYIFCALTNILIPQALFFYIAKELPASIVSIIIVLTPIFVYMSLIFFFKEPLIWRKVTGICLGLLGIFILFAPAAFIDAYNLDLFWLMIALLLPVDYATNRIFATKLKPIDASPYNLTIGLFICVGLMCAGLMIILGQTSYNPLTHLHFGTLALFSHALAMTIFYIIFFILAAQNAVSNSLSFYIAPLVGTSWGILLFNENIDIFFLASTTLVFSGLYLVTKEKIREK